MKAFSLAPSAALVTGSTQGIGHAIALGLQEAGASVVFHGLGSRPPSLAEGASFISGDLLVPDAPAALVTAAFDANPALDLLVCNAGSFFDVPFLDMAAEQWDRTMNLNVRATYFVVQAFARALVARQRRGSVVIISSTNGIQSEPDSTAYDTAKGALVMMTRSLAHSLAPHAIRVNGLAPGLIHTPLTAGWLSGKQPELRSLYEKKILLGRIGEPGDCVGAAVFLLSPAAAYITGQVLVVDGGLTVGQVGRV
jgi:NAD(P)-dependent dehydrogenase (short-subunit alcohol dehydrogenase family)